MGRCFLSRLLSQEGTAMPKPVPIPVRQKLFQRAQQGETTAGLAAAFDLAPRTVRNLLRRFRERGTAGLRPDSHPPAPFPHAYAAEIRDAALALRREHPTWGAVLIRVAPRQRRSKTSWPSPSTLRRWFRRAGLGPAPTPRRPR